MLVTKTSVIKMGVHFIYNICYLFGSVCYYSTGSNKLNNDLVAILFALMKIKIMLSELIDDGWLAANRLMATVVVIVTIAASQLAWLRFALDT